ncbi:MAG TPA: GNAT family N-acetyltransferase [Candidatus Limnocylindrales bacterium]
MPTEIRRVREDELTEYVDAMSVAFLGRPDVARFVETVRPLWDLERTWAAFDGGRMRGTLRTWSTELTVPGGGRLPAAAMTNVTVLATHRRQGIMRAMLKSEHEASRDRGDAVGLLHSAEYPIYGRFGYGPGCREASVALETAATGFHGEPSSGVDFAKPDERTRDEMKAVFEAVRLRQAGEIRRRDVRWDFDLGLRDDAWDPPWKGFVIIHRDRSGAADGYARYRAEERWEDGQPRNVLNVDELHALSDAAYASLWRFLAEMDWVARVKAERRRVDERLPWLLTNARAARVSDIGDSIWVRIHDVRRALEARTYERDGNVVVEVVDAELRSGKVRLRVDVDGGRATCRPTTRSADLTIGVAALGAAYLGGVPLGLAVIAAGCDEHREGSLAALDRILRTMDEPWCSTFF